MSTYQSIAGSLRLITQKNETTYTFAWSSAYDDPEADYVEDYKTLDDVLDRVAAYADSMGERQSWAGEPSYHTAVIVCHDVPWTLVPSWKQLVSRYHVTPLAKSPGDIYELLCYTDAEQKRPSIIFWDLRHVYPGTLDDMAQTLGKTLVTIDDEAAILLDYVKDLAIRHRIRRSEIASSVLTLTGVARHDAADAVGTLTFQEGRARKERTLLQAYRQRATTEAPRTYEQYALRKACNRGGLVFTAARHAGRIQGRTLAIDEASAHHAQAICRYVPERFQSVPMSVIQTAAERIARMSIDDVLYSYHMPFTFYFHAAFEFTGVRLRKGTVWEHEEIGTLSMSRFAPASGVIGVDDEAAVEAERAIRDAGYGDRAENARYAYGKLMSADRLLTHMTEGELFIFTHVYAYDSMRAVYGEATAKRRRPEDYAVLTSMHFYAQKAAQKAAIREGAGSNLRRVYDTETKPAYNAVGYGLHSRDEYRPAYHILGDGSWELLPPVSAETFKERRPKSSKAWYLYGIRISIGARLHLMIAVELLWRAYGERIKIAAGDTDSLKVVTDDVDLTDLLEALRPLHEATRRAIEVTTSRARELFPDAYDPMEGVGEFEADGKGTYPFFYTPGVKQYVLVDDNGGIDLTLAGVPRSGDDSYAAWLKQMVDAWGVEVLEQVFTFDVTLDPSVSQLRDVDYGRAYADSSLPNIRGACYTLNDTRNAEAQTTLAWQRDHGRSFDCDPQARATWTPAGAVFYYCYGSLKA